ncbi:MAG: hypothetical protein JXR58_06000 [Bacteroidales bacterium]|nr:hypothetical protein [Bacteroidales bacterium]
MVKSLLYFFVFLLCINSTIGQQDNTENFIVVHFVYGSKPAKGHKDVEGKWFGGIHGGHVKVQTTNYLVGFNPVSGFHIFSHRKKIIGGFVSEGQPNKIFKTTSFVIPVSKELHDSLESIIEGYLNDSPYDYAFFGMRCASAAYDLLSQIGIFKTKSQCGMVWTYFYPKLLRTKLFKLSEKQDIKITRSIGKTSRKWEKDRRKFEFPYPEIDKKK